MKMKPFLAEAAYELKRNKAGVPRLCAKMPQGAPANRKGHVG